MKSIAIIGMGTMGNAIQQRLSSQFELTPIDINKGNIQDVAKVQAIIIAVKPQQFASLSADLKPFINSQIIVSIMAGVPTQALSQALGASRVVRTMPNLGLRKGASLTAAFSPKAERGRIEPILTTWGTVLWLEDETQFDAFTALAGSGPAYFFSLAAALQTGAIQAGFTPAQAESIAVQTLKGSAAVIEHDPTDLITKVASKGGTTEAALQILASQQFDKTILSAVAAATERSKELSQ